MKSLIYSSSFAWILLLIAIIFEATWVIGLRFTEGWTKLIPSIAVLTISLMGMIPLGLASKSIAPSIVYSIWVGGGIVLVFLVDTFYFKEALSFAKTFCIFLILAGSVGLKILFPSGH